VGSPKISPDGRRVVYEQTRTDWDANAFETDLWIADVVTGERHLLSTAGHTAILRSGRLTESGSHLLPTGRDRYRSRPMASGSYG
jgi:dipeptidyl aminopeptidase/acylaminoacyl peptidase